MSKRIALFPALLLALLVIVAAALTDELFASAAAQPVGAGRPVAGY
ncbi:hypothetical protein ECZU24_15350 [Escherichia coli]|nr:hypothetical protein ECZU24_15350 [Escherichia coli]